jgi:BCCT family betaine/carnitine transporter
LFLQLTDMLDFVNIMNTVNDNAAIVATLASLPLAPLVIGVFALVAIIFAATTYDSASYSLASGATLHLSAGDDPARWHRVFWALALAVLPISLLFIGGIKTMQSLLLVVSLPILLVGVLMSVSLVKTLRADHPL